MQMMAKKKKWWHHQKKKTERIFAPFSYFCKFIYFEGGEMSGRKGERENPKQAQHCQHRAWRGARTHKPWDYDLSWNQELDVQWTEPPRQPCSFLKSSILVEYHDGNYKTFIILVILPLNWNVVLWKPQMFMKQKWIKWSPGFPK